jgi:hypothetical protein
VRDEVLKDHLLQMVEAGERLERVDAVGFALADADQDPARERDAEVLGVLDRLQAKARILRRRGLVGCEVDAQAFEHQSLGGGDLAQPGEAGLGEGTEVRVRQQPALERPLAAPGHVGDEVAEPQRLQLLADIRVIRRVVAGEDEQLLDAAARGMVEQGFHLVRRVQVRLMGRERAVLAMADARS